MKKVGKTTRTFRYNLNQIPFDYTVAVTKTIPKKKKCKKAKWLSEKALQTAEEKREAKGKGERG